MAVRRGALPRAEKRVPLKRPGSRGRGNTPVKKTRPQAPRRPISLPWRGISSSLTLAAMFCGIAILLAGVTFSLIYGYRAMTTGAYFSLKNIEIQGISRVASREVLEIAGINNGGNTLALSISDVENALLQHPWVREVSIRRVLPDTLIVTVCEKDPAFWKLEDGVLVYADARGKAIAPVVTENFTSLPTLEVEPGAEEAMRGLPDLVKSLRDSELPLDMQSISWVRLSAARGVEVFVEDTRLQISIGLEEWLLNLQRLGRTIADLKGRGELSRVRSIKAEGSSVWVEKRT